MQMILFLFILNSSCNSTKNGTPERLGENVFDAIKKNDFEKFKNCFITKDDFLYLLENGTYDTEQKRFI